MDETYDEPDVDPTETPETPVDVPDDPEETQEDSDDEVKQTLLSVKEVAQEVLDGKWGTGQERRLRLSQAGYDHVAVEDAVVKILNPPTE
jgi:hypothetical protein